MEDNNSERLTAGTAATYTCPHIATRDRQVRLNIPPPGSMRATSEAEGNFALECTMDELAYELKMDPLELRLHNDAEVHPIPRLATRPHPVWPWRYRNATGT